MNGEVCGTVKTVPHARNAFYRVGRGLAPAVNLHRIPRREQAPALPNKHKHKYKYQFAQGSNREDLKRQHTKQTNNSLFADAKAGENLVDDRFGGFFTREHV